MFSQAPGQLPDPWVRDTYQPTLLTFLVMKPEYLEKNLHASVISVMVLSDFVDHYTIVSHKDHEILRTPSLTLDTSISFFTLHTISNGGERQHLNGIGSEWLKSCDQIFQLIWTYFLPLECCIDGLYRIPHRFVFYTIPAKYAMHVVWRRDWLPGNGDLCGAPVWTYFQIYRWPGRY